MWSKIRQILDEKLIRPFRESHAPVQELALGSAIGMFWAMTPLVGIQMYLVTMSWLLMKLLGRKINLAVALAMVWISNPITMGPLYYAFYKTGYIAFDLMGMNPMVITFDNFQAVLLEAMKQDLLEGLKTWGEFLLNDLGWPTMFGGIVIATPLAIASYPVTRRMVNRHRTNLARKEGLTLEEWEAKHVHTFRDILKIEKEEHVAEKHMMAAAAHPEQYLALGPAPGKKSESRKKSQRPGARKKKSSTAKQTAGKKSTVTKKKKSSGSSSATTGTPKSAVKGKSKKSA